MDEVEELATRIRNHDKSEFTGETEREEVIRDALERELDRLEEQSELAERVEEKRSELRSDFGLSAEPDDDETASDAADKRAELRRRFRERN